MSRRLASTSSGLATLGRISPSRILRPRLADRLGRPDEVALDDLDRRAARHACDARRRRHPDREDEQPELRADGRDGDEREHDRGKARMTSMARIRTSSTVAWAVGGDEPDRDAEHEADAPSRRSSQPEHRAAAPEEAGEDVAAEIVGAELRHARRVS